MDIASDNLRGMFLDADTERLLIKKLPLVTETVIKEDGTETKRLFGEFSPIGDLHHGHTDFSRNVLNGYLNWYKKNPHVQLGLMGDYCECAETTRFVKDESSGIDEQIEQFAGDWRCFKDRIIFMLSGNHDERWARITKSNRYLRSLGLEVGVDFNKCYVGKPQRGVWVAFQVGTKIYGTYWHHSLTSARVNRKLQLKRSGSNNVVSVIGHGHTHELSWGERRTFRLLETVEGKIRNVVRRQYLVATGCFLRHPSYAEARSYPYTDVGAPIIRFYADQSEISIRDLTAHYKEYLTKGGTAWEGDKQPLSEQTRELLNKNKRVVERCLL